MTAQRKNEFLNNILQDASARVSASLDAWANPTPPRLLVNLPDLWGGDAEIGRHICTGKFVIGDQTWQAAQGDAWSSTQLPEVWMAHIHSFEWLSHLRACGSDAARREARHHIERFITRYGLRPDTMNRPDIMARRVIQWLTHFDFYGASATYEFQLEVRRSLAQQIRQLMKSEAAPGLPSLTQAVALSLAGLAVEEQSAAYALGHLWLDSVIKDFIKAGGVATRSAQDAVETLALLVTLRCAQLHSGVAVAENIKKSIDDLASTIRALRGADKKLPLFQGSISGRVDCIDQILKRADSRTRHNGASVMGYQKMSLGRTQLLVDCVALPSVDHDEHAHAAPLAIELWVGKDRVFTQCGSSPFLPPETQRALRGTSAHSTLSMDDRNVCEVRAVGGLGRRYPTPQFQRWELEGGVMIEACHSGYQDLFGITHKRKLALLEEGECLAGEDEITSPAELLRPHYATLRFHLHPRVQASLIQNDSEVLLRLPGNGGWRFSADGGPITLEDSLYCGSGRTQPTTRITITREMTEAELSIPWVVQVELPS